jgi:hypothetical protein
MRLPQTGLHTWKNYFLPLATLNYITGWRRIRLIRKCLLSNAFTVLAILLLLWRECRGEFSVRLAPSTDTAYWIIKQFQETGSACDKLEKGRKQFCSSFA